MPLYPVVLAALFPAYLLNQNLDEQVPLADALATTAVLGLVTATTLALLIALFRNYAWAAATTAVLVVWALGYSEFQALFPSQSRAEGWPLAVWSGGAVAVAMLVALFRGGLDRTIVWGNAITGVLLLLNLIPIIPNQVATAAAPRYEAPGIESLQRVAEEYAGPRPDIYYIVPDRYPSQATLAGARFDFDNRAFLNDLEERGFYVADESYANYITTAMSLASSLNMTYLDVEAMGQLAPTASDPKPIYDMLAGSLAAPAFLKMLGYTYIQIPSLYPPTAAGADVDVQLRHATLTGFPEALYRTTVVPPIAGFFGVRGTFGDIQIAHAQYQFEQLADLERFGAPRFVVSHILLPHPPYVFGESGPLDPAERTGGIEDGERERFLAQLKYTNTRIIQLIDELQAGATESHPVVIIQADEGPHSVHAPADWRDASPMQYQQKYGILSAFYMPGAENATLYPSITPVNVFRVVFNAYFESQLDLLDDRVHAYPHFSRLYEEFDITSSLPLRNVSTATNIVARYDVSPPKKWLAGTEQSYSVTVGNDGNETWRREGSIQLLVRFDPANGAAPPPSRLIPISVDVDPGESHTVTVSGFPPDVAGAYVLSHRLVYGITQAPSVARTAVMVEASEETWHDALSATYDHSAPADWKPGETQSYVVTASNTGSYTWNATGPHAVHLGIHFGTASDMPHAEWATDDRHTLPDDVAPGETATWTVEVRAPSDTGSWILRHRMVKEGITWFDEVDRHYVGVADDGDWVENPLAVLAAVISGLLLLAIFAYLFNSTARTWIRQRWFDSGSRR